MSWNHKVHFLEAIRGSHLLRHAVDQGWLMITCNNFLQLSMKELLCSVNVELSFGPFDYIVKHLSRRAVTTR